MGKRFANNYKRVDFNIRKGIKAIELVNFSLNLTLPGWNMLCPSSTFCLNFLKYKNKENNYPYDCLS